MVTRPRRKEMKYKGEKIEKLAFKFEDINETVLK